MKIAILDLYDNEPNTGIVAIKELIEAHDPTHVYQLFDIRQKKEWPIPEDWDVIISSGGPGNPADESEEWSQQWKHFFERFSQLQKPAFLICFSFQLFCHHFELGVASPRTQPAYGSFSCLLTPFGKSDFIFHPLPEKFQIADFRSFQITQPNTKNLVLLGAKVLAIEKERPKIDKEQALMAIRFTKTIYGTQFHPEANGDKVKETFIQNKDKLSTFLGNKQYQKALKKLDRIEDINQTQDTIIPNFLDFSISILNNDPKI